MSSRAAPQAAPASAPCLILVPTAFERAHLEPLPAHLGTLATLGLGPMAAAARCMQLLLRLRPRRVLVAGIAGSFELEQAPLASVACFDEVLLDGVGAGSGSAFRGASELGFALFEDGPNRLGERLALWRPAGCPSRGRLLSVHAASLDAAEARARRERYGASAEDMEAFGAAFACALEGVPLACLRAISNAVGERDKRAWCAARALAALREALPAVLESEWTAPA